MQTHNVLGLIRRIHNEIVFLRSLTPSFLNVSTKHDLFSALKIIIGISLSVVLFRAELGNEGSCSLMDWLINTFQFLHSIQLQMILLTGS